MSSAQIRTLHCPSGQHGKSCIFFCEQLILHKLFYAVAIFTTSSCRLELSETSPVRFECPPSAPDGFCNPRKDSQDWNLIHSSKNTPCLSSQQYLLQDKSMRSSSDNANETISLNLESKAIWKPNGDKFNVNHAKSDDNNVVVEIGGYRC